MKIYTDYIYIHISMKNMNLFYSLPLDIQQKIMMINFKIELNKAYNKNIICNCDYKDCNESIVNIFRRELQIVKSSMFELEYPIKKNNIYIKNLNELSIAYQLLELGGDSNIFQLLRDKCLKTYYYNFFEFKFIINTDKNDNIEYLIFENDYNIYKSFNEGIENFNKFLDDFFNDKSNNRGFTTLYKNELSKLKVKNRSKCNNLKERFLLLKNYYKDNYKYDISNINIFFTGLTIVKRYNMK